MSDANVDLAVAIGRLDQGLGQDISLKREEIQNSTDLVYDGAVTTTLERTIPKSERTEKAKGFLQLAAGFPAQALQKLTDPSLNKRDLLLRLAGSSVAGGIVTLLCEEPIQSVAKGISEIFAPTSHRFHDKLLDLAPLWTRVDYPSNIDLANWGQTASASQEQTHLLNVLLSLLRNHGSSFKQTAARIHEFDNFVECNRDNKDLKNFLVYRKAIDWRYLGFSDRCASSNQGVEIDGIKDKHLISRVLENSHIKSPRNQRLEQITGGSLSKLIVYDSLKYLDFDASTTDPKHISDIAAIFHSNGVLYCWRYWSALFAEADTEAAAKEIYLEYKAVARAMREAAIQNGKVDPHIFNQAYWALCGFMRTAALKNWQIYSEIESDFLHGNIDERIQATAFIETTNIMRTQQASPGWISASVICALKCFESGNDGLAKLEELMPQNRVNILRKHFCPKATREIINARRVMGDIKIRMPTFSTDAEIEGCTAVFEIAARVSHNRRISRS